MTTEAYDRGWDNAWKTADKEVTLVKWWSLFIGALLGSTITLAFCFYYNL